MAKSTLDKDLGKVVKLEDGDLFGHALDWRVLGCCWSSSFGANHSWRACFVVEGPLSWFVIVGAA